MKETRNRLRRAQYILNVMSELKKNPDDVVSSRYNINKVLEEVGVETEGRTQDQIYNDLDFLVQMELWGRDSLGEENAENEQ